MQILLPSFSVLLGDLACNQEDDIGYCFVALVSLDLVTTVFEPVLLYYTYGTRVQFLSWFMIY